MTSCNEPPSYGQNIIKHSKEVALIAERLAIEL
jgi:HD superfamily phosphodiesterase